MQEVVELQQQHRGTASHMEVVSQRLQAAEQKQKQMVSFLAKLLQNPEFIARLKQKKEQGDTGSSRTRRKFVKHQLHEPGNLDSPEGGQIVKYNLTVPSVVPAIDPVPVETSPDYLLHGMAETGPGPEGMPFQIENVASVDLAVSDKLAEAQGFTKPPAQGGEGASNSRSKDSQFEGKNVVIPREISPEYFVYFPEDLKKEKSIPEFSSPGIESIVKQEDIWSMGFNTAAGLSSSSNELLGNLATPDVPELRMSDGLSDLWDISSLQAAGGSGIDFWPADELPFNEPESQACQQKDRSKDP